MLYKTVQGLQKSRTFASRFSIQLALRTRQRVVEYNLLRSETTSCNWLQYSSQMRVSRIDQ